MDLKFGTALTSILKQQNITSVTDLGCGTGGYVKIVSDSNIKAQGFDGNPATKTLDVSGGLCVWPVDLTEEKFWETTDAAISIEVAEHIPAEFESAFLDNVVQSARRLVVLSWAVPGQGGEGHVNGQTALEVVQKMKRRGWETSENLTNILKTAAETPWLKQNIQCFLHGTE